MIIDRRRSLKNLLDASVRASGKQDQSFVCSNAQGNLRKAHKGRQLRDSRNQIDAWGNFSWFIHQDEFGALPKTAKGNLFGRMTTKIAPVAGQRFVSPIEGFGDRIAKSAGKLPRCIDGDARI